MITEAAFAVAEVCNASIFVIASEYGRIETPYLSVHL